CANGRRRDTWHYKLDEYFEFW
nr:immunoglobulin heavy chain junction region [Macaca mulatta]MOW94501.1 immunoglobulin heavy chain junction region [Macaca mulatta]MOW94513.1 immunoglobulin heavy chain junction region [Macaca mulatta]MOW95049.1 immunoglobulin heavy chain junction region [Macaca mulatta]MOW95055.1 immunoglobulin heavy chain junction region [Macaca mulatta]